MTKDALISHINKRIKAGSGSAYKFAESLDISPQYLSDVVTGKREPGVKILNALGLERVVSYRTKGAA